MPRGSVDPTALGVMPRRSRGSVDPTALGVMPRRSRGSVDPTALGVMPRRSRGSVDPTGLEVMPRRLRGSVDPAGISSLHTSGFPPVSNLLLYEDIGHRRCWIHRFPPGGGVIDRGAHGLRDRRF